MLKLVIYMKLKEVKEMLSNKSIKINGNEMIIFDGEKTIYLYPIIKNGYSDILISTYIEGSTSFEHEVANGYVIGDIKIKAIKNNQGHVHWYMDI